VCSGNASEKVEEREYLHQKKEDKGKKGRRETFSLGKDNQRRIK